MPTPTPELIDVVVGLREVVADLAAWVRVVVPVVVAVLAFGVGVVGFSVLRR